VVADVLALPQHPEKVRAAPPSETASSTLRRTCVMVAPPAIVVEDFWTDPG
jgi:hypothetical protein